MRPLRQSIDRPVAPTHTPPPAKLNPRAKPLPAFSVPSPGQLNAAEANHTVQKLTLFQIYDLQPQFGPPWLLVSRFSFLGFLYPFLHNGFLKFLLNLP